MIENMESEQKAHCLKIFDKIRIFVLDSDGVLTDGGLWYTAEGGQPLIRFDIQDGLGIAAAKLVGMEFAIISGRPNKAVEQRAEDLGISEVMQGVEDKAAALTDMAKRLGWDLAEVCFIGDDIKDLPAMEIAGCSIAVDNATDDVKDTAKYVVSRRGGHGAVREAIEDVLKAQGKWKEAVDAYIARRKKDP